MKILSGLRRQARMFTRGLSRLAVPGRERSAPFERRPKLRGCFRAAKRAARWLRSR